MTTLFGNASGNGKFRVPLLLALIAAGLAGNYFKFPIFLNIDFLFGSIFAMLALQFFGTGRGIAAAAIIAAYTYLLWNHPYAIIIMTAEVAVVSWLMARRKMGLVLADVIYWLVIGMPLVYLFYYLVMHASISSVTITMTKQAMNGIANAVVARLIFTVVIFSNRSRLISLREVISNLFIFFIMLQGLLTLATNSRTDFSETDTHIRTNLAQASKRMEHHINTWLINRKTAILNLAEMAASRSPQQMQPYLEQAKKSDVNFLRIGLLDSEATITAYFPLLDEMSHKNIGKNFADRPFIPILKRTLKPMLSEVVMGRIGVPKPMVTVLAPVIIRGEYGGYVTGILSLEQIREQLDKSLTENGTLYTLLDKNSNVIMTNRTDQTVMKPLLRGKGDLRPLGKEISQWIPVLPPTTPASERWKKSFYIAENSIGDLSGWRLILEQPVAPFQKKLFDNYTGKLITLFAFLLGVMALAEILSRRAVATLGKLSLISHDLPAKLAKDDKDIVWPDSGIVETAHLINNFQEMADSLTDQFHEVKQINETLEQRVEERTAELRENEQKLHIKNDELLATEEILRNQICEHEVIQTQLKVAKESAESANTTKSQFLANMSHEIRTPMNGVLGMTQLLEMTELTSEQREYVEALKLSGKNLLSLISDILDLSKIEAGKIILESAEFSLRQSINDIVLMQKSVAYEKHLALELNLSKDIPPLLVGDQLRIKQILLNLLGNAVKFTSHGSVTISTQLLEQHDNVALIQIAVRDSGIGISPESLDTIFRPFTQEDGSTSRKYGGTGLGLTISLRLAELMGGTISVESTQGVGSCFTVTLPFSIGRETATSQTVASNTTAGWDGPPLRILFAEDDQVNIKFGSSLLTKMGLEVIVVENGKECLTALEKGTFDLVLMDIQMPVMNGEEALKEIRRKEQDSGLHLPVIALTAYSMRGDKERFLEEGFDGYVSKPLITRELVAEMKRVLGLSGETKEATHG